jgi:NADH-quinone oxidoreductase subunit J
MTFGQFTKHKTMTEIVFYSFCTLAVASALLILVTQNVMYAALGLFVTLLGVVALFVFAGADFLAVSQLLIYVGGVLVLLIFGVMLTHKKETTDSQTKNTILTKHSNVFWGGATALGLFGLLFWIIQNAHFLSPPTHQRINTTSQIGMSLMTSHILPFEIAGILLLLALVGAGYLATHKKT